MNHRSRLDQCSRACALPRATSGQSCLFLGVISLLMSQNRGINHVQTLLNTADIFTRPFASWLLAALMTEMVIVFMARISPPLWRRVKFSLWIASPDTATDGRGEASTQQRLSENHESNTQIFPEETYLLYDKAPQDLPTTPEQGYPKGRSTLWAAPGWWELLVTSSCIQHLASVRPWSK